MKENKFKVGDRVVIYATHSLYSPIRYTGIVTGVDGVFVVANINRPDLIPIRAHFKQCRRLIPKKKKPGDEIWLNWDPEHYNDSRHVINIMSMANGVISVIKKEGWIKYKRCK